MYVRVITFSGASNIDAGVAYVRDKVIADLNAQRGYQGLTMSADRSNKVVSILTLWETDADREASKNALAKDRQEGLEIIGGTMAVENFEQLVAEMAEPPQVGSSLTVTRISMEPAKVDENLAFFKSDVLPRIKATSGFRAVRNMMNRQTGHGIVGIVWSDEHAMNAAAADAKSRREVAASRGVSFDEVSSREIVLTDFH